MIHYQSFGLERLEEVKELYRKEGWTAYLREEERLPAAFQNSLFCYGAFDAEDTLLGFIRCVGDGEHVVLVQDLIVEPAFQRQGIGSTLFRTVLRRYQSVRMLQLVTDLADERDNSFYRAMGMKPLADGSMIAYYR